MDATQLGVDRILDRLCADIGLVMNPVAGTGRNRDADSEADLELELSGGGEIYPVQIQVKPVVRGGGVEGLDHARKDGVYRLVVSDRVTPVVADRLRDLGYWFVDRCGNAYLSGPGLYVDIRGRQARSSGAARSRLQPQNLFTPRRSQVICMLLADQSLSGAPLRKISETAGTSLAVTKGTVDLLVQSEFMETHGRERWIVEPELLLDSWASSFRFGLGRDLLLMKASGLDRDFHIPKSFSASISGENAVPELIRNPETLTVYVDVDDRGRIPVPVLQKNRWRQDDSGDVTVRRRFWRSPNSAEGIHTAPLPLVYADLLEVDDSRLREVSGTAKEEILGEFR